MAVSGVVMVAALILSPVKGISGLQNLALGRPSLQKSDHYHPPGDYTGYASKAVDGDPDPYYTACSITKAEVAPWWQVDLGTSQPVSTVVIVNRGDHYVHHLYDFYVGLTNTSAADSAPTTASPSYEVFAFHPGVPTNLETFLYTTNPPVYGRYLVVQIDTTAADHLILCEVEVYSDVLVNVARGRPAWHGPGELTPASGAIDGVVWTTIPSIECSHTARADRPWWVVDLGGPMAVAAVTILNRGDCCSERLHDFYIGVSDSSPTVTPPNVDPLNYGVCAFHAGTLSHRKQLFTCDLPLVIGHYLVVQLTSDASFLSLCEVEVFQDPSNFRTCTLP